jgi:translocation and assembly module TamA
MKKKSFPYLLLALSLGLYAGAGHAKPVTYDVRGIKGEPLDNIHYYLAALPPIESDYAESRARKITLSVRKALQAMGYYTPKMTYEFPNARQTRMVIHVDAGEPVRMRTLDLQLKGDAEQDPDFLKILASLDLKKGDVLRHDKYEKIKQRLKTLAATNGYFDAKLETARVDVYPTDHVADLTIVFDSGKRYSFGDISIEGIEQHHLIKPLFHFKPNDKYDTRKLADLSQGLSQTRYFQVVDVHPQLEHVQDYHVPIDVKLEKRKSNAMETGIGVSTDEGPRVQWNWERPWVNQYGHRFSSQIKIAQTTQTVDFSYRITNKNPIDDYYLLQTTYENVDQDDTKSQKVEAGIHYWTAMWGDWKRDYFFKTAYEDYTQGEDVGDSLLFMPGATLTRVRSRGGIDPYWGDSQSFTVMVSDRAWGSDTRFVKLWGKTKWLRTYAENHRFIVRAEQGVFLWGHLDEIPASQRFFTGGDQTVRGFGYETISPKDSSGDLSGALKESVASLEYDYHVAPKWWLATFVDAGTATNDYHDPWKIGTGLGFRWMTPVGPFKVDFAFGVSEPSVPFRLHFALGPEL